MDENKSLKNLLRPIVQYVNEEVEKSEQRLKESFPTNTKGDVGAQGERGPKGDQGDPGGPPGPKGEKGNVGVKGERGEQGFLGEQGEQGEKGDVGPQGERGERGFLGEQGPPGDQGIQGVRGFTGDPGDKGDKGDKGDRGEIGPRGLLGEQGIQGLVGETGSRGARGQRGQKGDDGPKGDRGDAGAVGLKGERGLQGPKGDKGDPGDPGNTKRLEENFDALREDVAVQVRQARRSLMGSLADGPGTGAVRVMDQDDVKPGTPADGQILKYDSSEGKFVLSTDSATGFATEAWVYERDFTTGAELDAQIAILAAGIGGDITALQTANTIQNTELGNLSAQTATFKTATGLNLWGNTQGTTPNTFTVPSGMSAHTIDLTQSNLFLIKLENSVTITLSNMASVAGSAFTIIVTQDGSGSKTWTWAAGTKPKFPGGYSTALSTTANAIDIISLVVANSTFVYSTSGINYK